MAIDYEYNGLNSNVAITTKQNGMILKDSLDALL